MTSHALHNGQPAMFRARTRERVEDLAFALEGVAGALAEQKVSPAAAGLAQVRTRCLPGFLMAHRVCWGIC